MTRPNGSVVRPVLTIPTDVGGAGPIRCGRHDAHQLLRPTPPRHQRRDARLPADLRLLHPVRDAAVVPRRPADDTRHGARQCPRGVEPQAGCSVSPAEAASRLDAVRQEMEQAAALGLTRELASWSIAVEVLDAL